MCCEWLRPRAVCVRCGWEGMEDAVSELQCMKQVTSHLAQDPSIMQRRPLPLQQFQLSQSGPCIDMDVFAGTLATAC